MWGLLVVAYTLLVRQEKKSHLLFDLCRWQIDEEDVDLQAFIEAIGAAVAIIVQVSAMAATTARTSATMGEGGTSNL